MQTAEVAQRAGVNAQTLRYYERRGLLPSPGRSAAGYRSYGPEAVRIVRFVKHAQRLGFSLADIEVLLGLAAGGPESCDAAQGLAASKITELDAKIAQLTLMRDSLRRLVATCDRPPDARECPLLHALGTSDEKGTRNP
jgi:DNA-binding transcriptional MerR regulator